MYKFDSVFSLTMHKNIYLLILNFPSGFHYPHSPWHLEVANVWAVFNTLVDQDDIHFAAGRANRKLEHNEDGIESTLMTNFVGPFLLTHLLMPRLATSGTPDSHSRIINVSSEVHKILPSGKNKKDIDWKDLNGQWVLQ